MPAFMFLSGMFHKNERIVSKVVSYLSICFMLKVGLFIGNILISKEESFSVFSENHLSWFMLVLAGYITASYILRDIDKRFLFLIAVMLGCFVGYDHSIGDFLALSRGFFFYPFYVLGEICDKEHLAVVSRKPVLRFIGGTILAGWAIVCFAFNDRIQHLTELFTGNHPFSDASFPWGPAWRVLHYSISLLLVFSIICVISGRSLRLLTVMGGRSMQIYFWHWPVVKLLNTLTGVGTLLCQTGFGQIAWVFTGVLITVILGLRIFSFPTEFVLWATGVRTKQQDWYKIKGV